VDRKKDGGREQTPLQQTLHETHLRAPARDSGLKHSEKNGDEGMAGSTVENTSGVKWSGVETTIMIRGACGEETTPLWLACSLASTHLYRQCGLGKTKERVPSEHKSARVDATYLL